jgi:hypothetical protein
MLNALLILLILFCPFAKGAAAPMVYRYWDLGASEKRDQYQFELLRLALEKTRGTYGDYQLIRVTQKITSLRASREVSRGEFINIEAAPNWTTESADSLIGRAKRIAIKIPLLHGLLGYRRLVVRHSDLEKFNQLKDEAALRALVAGQGKDWEDVFIYQANGYKVNDEADYYNLFAMLVAKRFDYIPLSIVEVDNFVAKFSKFSNDVAVVPHILIYYPFPVLFQVSINKPELARRLEIGLSKAEQDGSMDRLFESYFQKELAILRNESNRIFVLENERVPRELQLKEPMLIRRPAR